MKRLLIFLVLFDQVSKRSLLWFSQHSATVTLVKNTGIAFGMFSKIPYFILIVNVGLLISIIWSKTKIFPASKWGDLSFTFIVAGGIGNLIDRLLLGYVIDFLKLPYMPYFNFADSFINIGIGFFVISQLLYEQDQIR